MNKMYIVVRADLPAGLQLPQACHALQLMNDQHPEVVAGWRGNIAVLAARDKQHMSELVTSLQRSGIVVNVFLEPDEGGDPTSFSATEDAARQLSSLPKALKPPLLDAA